MRKILFILLTAVLLSAALPSLAEEARDITKSCRLTRNDRNFSTKELLDRKYTTYQTLNKGAYLTVDGKGKELSGLFLQFFDHSAEIAVQVQQDGEWVTVAEGGRHLSDWFPLPAGTTAARVANTSRGRIYLAEVTAFGSGDRPRNAASWRDLDKADLMLLAAHPDDELLWFGGLLPTYAGERGLNVQVVYAVTSTPQRRLELLDGLWTCGVDTYPIWLGMTDKRTKTLDAMYQKWSKNKLFGNLTEAIRRVRPEVLVTQDFKGEYGHGAHRAMADAAVNCVRQAADETRFKESAGKYGTWQVKKLYIHLYDKAQIRLDWHVPLAAFAGKDGMQIATEALACHASQTRNGWEMTEGGSTDNTLFGLYFTAVGPDEAGDDLMEHIPQAGDIEWTEDEIDV